MPKSPTPERDGAREASRSIYTPSTKRESRETGQYRLTKKTFIILTTVTHNPDLTSALTKKSFERTSSFFWSSPLEF